MREIIKAQGGNSKIDSEEIPLGKITYELKSVQNGLVQSIHNKNLNKSIGERVKNDDILCIFYTNSKQRLILAKHALQKLELYKIKTHFA